MKNLTALQSKLIELSNKGTKFKCEALKWGWEITVLNNTDGYAPYKLQFNKDQKDISIKI